MLNEKALNLQPQGLRMRTHIIPLVVVNEHAELILNRCKVLMYAGSHKGGIQEVILTQVLNVSLFFLEHLLPEPERGTKTEIASKRDSALKS